MKRRLVLSPRADQDIDEQFTYFAEHDPATAMRFYDAAFRTFNDLLLQPFQGATRKFRHKALADLRIWFIQGFEKHLIFYQVTERRLLVVRVLHSSRNLEDILEEP